MKSRKELSEKDIKALLSRLKVRQAHILLTCWKTGAPGSLFRFPGWFILASKAIYKTILHGIQSTVAGVTKVILLSVIGITTVERSWLVITRAGPGSLMMK